MATKRITVSVPVEVAARMKRAAGPGGSVSEWVTHAVTRRLEEEDVRRRFLEFCDAVEATAADVQQAQASFDRIKQGKNAARSRGVVGRRRKTAA
jgi:Arc/MetJ-type ribon-helix-helix transcriptional regulator